MKKLMSIALALVLVLAMAAPAMAADATYTITINNAAEGHTYQAYQIFTGDLSEGTLSNIVWGDGVTEAGQTAMGDAAAKAEALVGTDAKVFAEAVSVYLTGTATESTYVEDHYEITVNKPGYYLIKDKKDSLQGKDDSYTNYILAVVKDTTVTPKSDKPTSQKKVKDINDSDSGKTTDWQDSADYDIGDSVPFQLKATLPENYSDYNAYQLIFHDKESEGLAFNADSVKVYIDGNEVASSYYTVVTPETTELKDGCTFEIRFADLTKVVAADNTKAHNGSVITVEYTSRLDNDAVIGAVGNPNTMHIEYSNNPNDDEDDDTGETPDDKVIVFTYKVVVNKVDEDQQPLAGAEFTLYKYIVTDEIPDGVEDDLVVKEEEDVVGYWKAITAVKADAGTTFTFSGLDDGNYQLVETTTPAGYNTIAPIEFAITAEHDDEADDPKLLSLNGVEETGEVDLGTQKATVDTEEGSLTTAVVNNKGTILPETGGIGTTIFYVAGGLLVAGALVLLITKRKAAAK